MTCKIQLLSIVDLPSQTFREIRLTVFKSGVEIRLESFYADATPRFADRSWSMSWAEAADPEAIAVACEFETVAVFRQLVTMLGKVYAMRATYEDLL